MTTYYVGPGGDNANSGLTWALRKLTLNGAEDVPVVAGDTVYVGPGTYRELLTVDVSGTAGNPITYIGDYTGANTDGIGGVVRITGSDNDQTATRANCITATSKTYRTFKGFSLNITTGNLIAIPTNCTNIIIDLCVFDHPISGNPAISTAGVSQSTITIQNCVFIGGSSNDILLWHSAVVDNSNHLVQNCIFTGTASIGVRTDRVGGVTVKNCVFAGTGNGVRIGTALTIGQTVTVNNCIFIGCSVALQATVAGEIVENYNTFYANATDRTNVNTGANSITYPPLFDPRWAFQLMYANPYAQVISPFDLASFSQLVNLAGTSPTTTDLRGQAILGAQREWGALEYNSILKKMGQILRPYG